MTRTDSALPTQEKRSSQELQTPPQQPPRSLSHWLSKKIKNVATLRYWVPSS